MIKKEIKHVSKQIIPPHDEEIEYFSCDKCGDRVYNFEGCSHIRVYQDSDVYKERKYKYYLGYDLCADCIENFLLPLLEKELHKEPNKYEEVYDFDE